MALAPGDRVGPYSVTALIGKGGMGEVWKARDTRLGRDVAIKVLPATVAQDADRRARFAHEARILASLNHANIASIYGLEEASGDAGPALALVMELVEGDTLADRLAGGPIPFAHAIALARQIAEALEAAHEKGIVHRDLKPANIKVTPDGKLKVLDFGLAKAFEGDPAAGDVSQAETRSMTATRQGLVLGTAPYMSPEQAQGKAADHRADVWAFGVVLYELLTGRRPFSGETVQDTLASILRDEPDWRAVPERARRLLRHCLEKDPRHRLRDIGDMHLLLEDTASSTPPVRRVRLMAIVAASIALAGIALWSIWMRGSARDTSPVVRFVIDLEAGSPSSYFYGANAVLSPDGTRLVFVAEGPDGRPRLYSRELDQQAIVELPGTEGAHSPFISANGRWVGFFAEGELKRIAIDGGAAVALAKITNPRGGSWEGDETIVLSLGSTSTLGRVATSGGGLEAITDFSPGEGSHRWPQVLPDRKGVLFTSHTNNIGFDGGNLMALAPGTRVGKVIVKGGTYGRYLASGHLVYLRGGTLFAQKFDLDRLQADGREVPVLEDVAYSNLNGGAQLDVSLTGAAIYTSAAGGLGQMDVRWMEPGGKTTPLLAKPGLYLWPRVSRDGRVALTTVQGANLSNAVYDRARDRLTPLTVESHLASAPMWSADERLILFRSEGGMSWIRSDSGSAAQPLTKSRYTQYPWSLQPGGKRLAYYEQGPPSGFQLWTLPLDTSNGQLKAGPPEPFLVTPMTTFHPAFSPDGRWIAYDSNESGVFEVHVRPFPPGSGGNWIVSVAGGSMPAWSPNGRELFYKTFDQRLMVVSYTSTADSFVPDKPRPWSPTPLADTGTYPNYDVAPDGRRLVVLMPIQPPRGRPRVTFVSNFFAEIERRYSSAGRP
jgi:serine/threonine-protein kinase